MTSFGYAAPVKILALTSHLVHLIDVVKSEQTLPNIIPQLLLVRHHFLELTGGE